MRRVPCVYPGYNICIYFKNILISTKVLGSVVSKFVFGTITLYRVVPCSGLDYVYRLDADDKCYLNSRAQWKSLALDNVLDIILYNIIQNIPSNRSRVSRWFLNRSRVSRWFLNTSNLSTFHILIYFHFQSYSHKSSEQF